MVSSVLTGRAATTSRLILLSATASITCGQSDLQIDARPEAFGDVLAVSAWWNQVSDFGSLYCVVYDAPNGVSPEVATSSQIIKNAMAAAERQWPTTPAPDPASQGHGLATASSSQKAMLAVQKRTAKCKSVNTKSACSKIGNCEWHDPGNHEDEEPVEHGECDINPLVAIELLGKSDGDNVGKSEAGKSTQDSTKGEMPEDETLTRRLSGPDGPPNAAAVIAEGNPLKPCGSSLAPFDVPTPCVDADKHRAHFFFRRLLPGRSYEAYCATSAGASAVAVFEVADINKATCRKSDDCDAKFFCWDGDCRDTRTESVCNEYRGQATDDGWTWSPTSLFDDPNFKCWVSTSSTAEPTNASVAPAVPGGANFTDAPNMTSSRLPHAAGGSTLEHTGNATDDKEDGAVGGGAVLKGAGLITMVFLGLFWARHQGFFGSRGGGLLSEDHEMMPGANLNSNAGSYVSPGDPGQTFSQLKDGPE